MTDCVYCGKDAGAYDEHEDCVLASMAAMIDAEEPCVFCDFPMSRHQFWSPTTCVVDGPPAVVPGGPS